MTCPIIGHRHGPVYARKRAPGSESRSAQLCRSGPWALVDWAIAHDSLQTFMAATLGWSGLGKRTFGHQAQRSHDDTKPWSDISVEPLICCYLSFSGNGRLSQFVEQRLSLFEVGRIEPFGKPTIDRGEQCHRLLRPSLLSPQAGEAHRAA